MAGNLEARVGGLWVANEQSFLDGVAANGAFLAANSSLPQYPSGVENYGFSWPGRDGGYTVMGMHAAELPQARDLAEGHLRWLCERTDFLETGIIVKRYYPNGPADWRYGLEPQPDQAATLAVALHLTGHESSLADTVVKRTAQGLTQWWEDDHFNTPTDDLWENQRTKPSSRDVFTYSLAAAAAGLQAAVARFQGQDAGVDDWRKVRAEMLAVLNRGETTEPYSKKIYPVPVHDPNNKLDASLLGLTWPFAPVGEAQAYPILASRSQATIRAIGAELLTPNGLQRYQGDTYSGRLKEDGASCWPLLDFWHAIALKQTGNDVDAENAFWANIDRLDYHYRRGNLPDNELPEQLPAADGLQVILPLNWTRAKFALAVRKLNILDKI